MTQLIEASVVVAPSYEGMLEPLLDIADSSMTYRRRYFAEPQLAPVLDLLLADASNTRALAFQLRALADHVDQLPRDPQAPSPTREQRLVAHALQSLSEADPDTLANTDASGGFTELLTLLSTIDADLRGLSDALTYYYFSHADVRVN
jgi:uncharacterized alpha-E superfamily protein